jgi:hypothetical protein
MGRQLLDQNTRIYSFGLDFKDFSAPLLFHRMLSVHTKFFGVSWGKVKIVIACF